MEHREKPARGGQTIPMCGVQGCCPTVELTSEGVVLRDEHEGVVRLTRDEWLGFLSNVKNGSFEG
jgi:hypothetical protein